MRKDNKGYSLVEVLIVIAIMALLAGLGMVTFNSANRQRATKAKDNLVTTSKYAKSLVQAQSSDYCVAIMKSSDNSVGYYAVIGTSTGYTQTDLRDNFRSENIVVTEKNGVKYKKTDPTDTDKAKKLAELVADPTIAQNTQALGNRIVIKYKGTEITEDPSSAVIIKFSKYDGSVIAGAGEYEFSNKGSSDVVSKVVLNEITGKFTKGN